MRTFSLGGLEFFRTVHLMKAHPFYLALLESSPAAPAFWTVGESGSSCSFTRIYGTRLSAPIRLHLWDLVFSNRGAGGKGSSFQDATGCRLRLLQHFCWLSLWHRENPIAASTPSKFQAWQPKYIQIKGNYRGYRDVQSILSSWQTY